VHAKNSAQVLSSSAWLRNAPVSVTTVGPPGPAAGGVSGVVINPQGHVQVSWGASNPNGSPSPVTYSVGRFVEGEVLPTSCQPPSPGSGGEVASPWVDATVGDQVTYRYAVYSDNDFYCTVTVSGPVLTMQPPGQASGSTTIEFRDGQFDVRAGSDLAVASLTAEKFQVSINGGAFSDVVPGQWLTSSANLAVYGSDLTVQYRGCRDSSELFCGPASDPTTVKPVNTRVPDMLSCVVGAQAMPSPPANPGGTPTVSYLFSFHDGGAASEWSAFSPDGTVPPPAPPLDPDDPDEPPAVVQVRVKATVDFGDGTPRTNEGFEQFMCSTS
ncbi:MAG TPA: hypothetical protein PK890_08475, partial [Terrimesophilobacter sp.]|nr:hypothetical protein [Terrimesophilobacter sp.]